MKRIMLLTVVLFIFSINIFSQNQDAIKVGVFVDLSGQTASFGEATKNGVELATEDINNAGGINSRKIELIFKDNKGYPERAKKVVEELITKEKVHVILGDVASTLSLAAAPVAQKAKIPMITPTSTNPKVTEVGDYIFRTCFIDPHQGEAMAKFAFYQLNLRKVAIFGDVNSDYSKGLAENFKKTFTGLGGKIVSEQAYTQQDDNFRGQLTVIKKSKPDAIYLPGYYGETAQIAKEARAMKINIPLLGGDGWDSPELWKIGGEALNNSYITNHFAADNSSSAVQDFVVKHETKFKSKPDTLAALGYDTVYLMADALKRAKTVDGEKLRNALARTTNFYGVTGKIERFDESRNPVKPIVILKLQPQTQKFVYYSTIEP